MTPCPPGLSPSSRRNHHDRLISPLHRPLCLLTLGIPLYPHQLEVAQAILASIEAGHGRLITVMMDRQSGKNQPFAVLEAYLLAHMPHGTIVKASLTFTPQITISRLRLLTLLSASTLRDRLWTSQGSIIGLTPHPHLAHLRLPSGPRIMFYSATPDSNVVGATADLLEALLRERIPTDI